MFAATIALGTVIGLPARVPAGASVRPRLAPTATPAKGIAITLGYADYVTDAKAMAIANALMSMVSTKLHANAVELNFPFWQKGSASDQPMRAPMTPSPQRLMAITAIAHRYHLAVQWRPFLFEGDLKFKTHNSIEPTDPTVWMENYWRFLRPYLTAATLSGVSSFSVALELPSMLNYLSLWTSLVRRAKAYFPGELLYSQQHKPQVSIPLTSRGYDAYQPISLRSPKDVSAAAFTRGFEHNLSSAQMQSSPADLTLEEVSIPATPLAYLHPAEFRYPPGAKLDRAVQTDWFEGACNAFWQLHLQGLYYYAIAFNQFTPNENKSNSVSGWLGTTSATAIANCYARTASSPAADVVPSSSPAVAGAPRFTPGAPRTFAALAADAASRATRAAHVTPKAATVVWDGPQAIEATGGHPASISCPTPGFCAEVDRGGDVLTESSGAWSRPLHADDVGLDAISCTSSTFCVAVDDAGNAFSYDGSNWTETAGVDRVELTSVSCAPTTTTCVAGDVAGDAITYQAGKWSSPVPFAASPVNAISCASVTYCVAVDTRGNAYTRTTTWSLARRLGSSALTAVSCPSPTFCLAADDAGRLYEDLAGAWQSHSGPLLGGVTSLSCGSPTSCEMLGGGTAFTVKRGFLWSGLTNAFPGDEGVSVSCATGARCTAASFDGSISTYTTSWSKPSMIDERPGNLTAVSCGSTTFCMGVDDAGDATTWDGAAWSAPSPTGLGSVSGVSCVGEFCFAVSNSGAVAKYQGGAWGHPRTLDPSALTAVSCVTTSYCAATDAANHVLLYTGVWSPPRTLGVNILFRVRGYTAVSCGAPGFCVAVDTSGHAVTFGTGTAVLQQADTANVPLTAVSCASSTSCVAVDEQGRAVTLTTTDGTAAWSRPTPISAYRLTSVSCTLDSFCLAVDDGGGAAAYANGAWTAVAEGVPLPGAIGAVSCSSLTCAATDVTGGAVSTATT